MIIRNARIITLALALNLLLGLRPAIGDESSLPKLSSDSQTETKKISQKKTPSQPSTLSRMTTGTKKFFGKVGDTLTFKKAPPPKTSNTHTNPWIKPAKEEPKPSWLTSMFYKEEIKKPNSPSEWLEQKRLDP